MATGSGIADERPTYFETANTLTGRYPILFYLTDFLRKQDRQPPSPVRAAVLEFYDNEVSRIDFDGSSGESGHVKLENYLSSPNQCKRRLYILEDLDPTYIKMLGAHLNVDGTVFAAQIRDTHFSGGWEHGHQPKLPSHQDPHSSFTLRYYEARYFNDGNLPDFSASMWTGGNLPRRILLGRGRRTRFEGHVGLTRARNYDGHVGLVRRNASFWSRKEEEGTWNALILVDSSTHGQVSIVSTRAGPEVRNVPNYAYQGGYRDFMPWPTGSNLKASALPGPSRTSLLDDIAHYWTQNLSVHLVTSTIKTPYKSSSILRNIIASTWMNTNEYIQAILSELETKLWEIERMISPTLSNREKDLYMHDFTVALNEVNTMRRRLNWFIAEMKLNCESLGTSPDIGSSEPRENLDFIVLYHRLVTYQNWAERLMGVITTSVNLMETEKSLADSRSLARLTVLGFVFIPLSFVATFFSMSGDFGVGQRRFWIYFGVSIPLTLLTFVLAFGKWRMWWNEVMFMQVKKKRD